MDGFTYTSASQGACCAMSSFGPDIFDFGPPTSIDRQNVQKRPQKAVKLRYDTHNLHGELLLLLPEEFTDLHSRFFDIHPDEVPRLTDPICEPWVLLHSILGKTWIDVGLLPEAAYLQSAYDVLLGRKEPSFVALTDNTDVFKTVGDLGHCDVEGNLTLTVPTADHGEALIIALASHRPFHGLRTLESRKITKQKILDGQSVIDYPPLAVEPSLIRTINSINAASEDPATSIALRPKKFWVAANFPELNDARYMSEKHALYRHRGNEAVFPRDVWHILCYPVTFSEEKAVERRKEEKGCGEKIPEPYYQLLFADLQARERVEGTSRLKDVDQKYYDDFGPEASSNVTTEGFGDHGQGQNDVQLAYHSFEDVDRYGGIS